MSEEQVAELEGEVLPEKTTGDVGEAEESAPSPEETPADPEAPKEAKGVQKRINELTANWREAQRRADRLEQHILTQQAPQQQNEAQAQPIEAPKQEDYDSYEAYIDARADYRADQRFNELKSELQSTQTRAQQQAALQAAQQQFDERARSFRESHDDFDEVAFNPSLPITEDMVGLLNGSEKGPELLYHLGTNPEEAARLSRLPVAHAAMELGRIEASLGRLPPRTTTNAPTPIEPVADGQGSLAVDPDDMTADEWRAWRNKQLE